jgi:hypothetical protein
VNNKVDLKTRLRFRDWLRNELRDLDFYQRRGDHYLIREFAKYCIEHHAPIDEASLGRYLRDDEPVLPTPERCRALARVFEYAPVKVLIEAGYLEGNDLFPALPKEEAAAKVGERREIAAEAAQQAGNVEPLKIIIDLMEQAYTPQGSTASRAKQPVKQSVKQSVKQDKVKA